MTQGKNIKILQYIRMSLKHTPSKHLTYLSTFYYKISKLK